MFTNDGGSRRELHRSRAPACLEQIACGSACEQVLKTPSQSPLRGHREDGIQLLSKFRWSVGFFNFASTPSCSINCIHACTRRRRGRCCKSFLFYCLVLLCSLVVLVNYRHYKKSAQIIHK